MSNPPDYLNTGPRVDVLPDEVKSNNYVLNELKRILWWDNPDEILKRKQRGFVASHEREVLAGGTLNLHLLNPEDSGVTADIRQIIGGTQFRGVVHVFDSFDVTPSGGTEKQIDNLLMDSSGANGPTSGNMVVNVDVDFTQTPDTEHFEATVPSGGTGGGAVGGSLEATTPLLEPGREIVVQVQNQSQNDRSGSLGFVFYEDAEVYSE